VIGLADHRPVRKRPQFGELDDAVVEAMRQVIDEAVDASTRTGTFLLGRTGEILETSPDGRQVKLPSQRTLYRLLAKLTAGTHTTGSATTRRSSAHGAQGPHGELPVFAPGEVMQIDSTPLDVLVRLDNGIAGKVGLTAMVDVATRTVTAAVLRPTTKSVDASVLPARTVTPELMRPDWVDALKTSRSVLPHPRLPALDERLEHAAARPVIVPEMIVCDHGKAFISRSFRSACRFSEIEFQSTHKGSPFEKGYIEKTLGSVATLFAQFLPGCTGRSSDHRGRHLESERLWSLLELQDLLDEWTSRTGRNAPTTACATPPIRAGCSLRTRSTPPWSRSAATPRSRSAVTTASNSCPPTGGWSTTTTRPFPHNSEWWGLIAIMEDTLSLRRHKPTSLARLNRYLHDRTGGMIGALSHRVRGAAMDAILGGSEGITEAGLEAVPLDVATQAPEFRGPGTIR
jgi:hypothetical protein